MFALWKAPLESAHPTSNAVSEAVSYTEDVQFLCDVRVPRATVLSKKRRARRARRLFGISSASDARRQLEPKEGVYEWVDYRAPLVCIEEEDDGSCLREEPAPCAKDPNALVCSVDTRQLPQKRKRRPWVSVCIDDMGVDYYMSRRAVRLRPAVTLSYLPYGPRVPGLPGVRDQARAASAAGHELLVHLPMEPFNKAADAGPNALHSGMTSQQLKEHLNWALAQFEGYVGVNNHMGSLFTSKFHNGMKTVLEELHKRDLFFLDSLTANNSLGQELAAHLGTTFGARDVFLDSKRDDVEAVEARLQEVEELALKNGHAIAIGHPYEATLEALERWLPLLDKKGLLLMPLKKALLREKKERERAAGEAVLAITRTKQLRAAQARREQMWREQRAQAVAAELEAQFGDGTVFRWEGLLDDPAAVQALRQVVEQRKRTPSFFQRGLHSLLKGPLGGRRPPGGSKQGGEGRAEAEAVRAVRRVMRPRQLPVVVSKPWAPQQAHRLQSRKQRERGEHERQGLARCRRARREARRGDTQRPGLMGLLLEDQGAPCWEGEKEAGNGSEGEGPGPGAELGMEALWQGRPLLVSRRHTEDGQGLCRRAHLGRQQRQGKEQTGQAGEGEETQAETGQRAGRTAHVGEEAAHRASEQGDRRGGLLLTALLQHRGEGQLSRVLQAGAGRSSRQMVEGLSLGLEKQQVLGTKRWSRDSPRTVISANEEEEEGGQSTPDYSPTRSSAESISPDGSFEVGGAWSVAPQGEDLVSVSRTASSMSEGSSEGRREGSGEGAAEVSEAALQLATTVAIGLAVAMEVTACCARWRDGVVQGRQEGGPSLVGAAGVATGAAEAQQAGSAGAERQEEKRGARAAASLELVPPLEKSEKLQEAAPSGALDEVSAQEAGCLSPRSSPARPACDALEARRNRKERGTTPSPRLAPNSGEARDPEPSPGGADWRDGSVPGIAGVGEGLLNAAGGRSQADQTEAACGEAGRDAARWRAVAQDEQGVAPVQAEAPKLPSFPPLKVRAPALGAAKSSFSEKSPIEDVSLGLVPSLAPAAVDGRGEVTLAHPGSPCHSSSSSEETEWGDAEDSTPSLATSPASSCSLLLGLDAAAESGRDQGSFAHLVDGLAKTVEVSGAVGGADGGTTAVGLRGALLSQQEASPAERIGSVEEALAVACEAAADVQQKKGTEQSTLKKYGWWRWTVGCVLSSREDAGQVDNGEAGRHGGLWSSRRVIPLNIVDP